eukprot:s113_g44.t1
MLRTVLFSLLAPAAVAQCLGNGTHPSLRKNLVNPETGESFPLGITMPAWAASYATSYMAGILIQDLLGFNVTYTVVQGQVEAFFSVAGCLQPNNSSDRGCGAEGPSVTACLAQSVERKALNPADSRLEQRQSQDMKCKVFVFELLDLFLADLDP